MASISSSKDNITKRPNAITKRKGPHMDFTPMVDLGFLLITFFMLTTSLSKPTIMSLVMPDDSGDLAPTKQSKVLTLLLGADNHVYSYKGMDIDQVDTCQFGRDGLRQVILQKMAAVNEEHGLQAYHSSKTNSEQLGSPMQVLIKPGPNARYANLVDALDEMAICQVRYYCVLPPDSLELQLITSK